MATVSPPANEHPHGDEPATPAPTIEFDYDLFISYSTDPDYRLARRLESFLESFHHLRLPGRQLRQLRVCLDGSDFSLPRTQSADLRLPPTVEVRSVLHDYLSRSRRLLVVCSSNASRSTWVDEEVQWFLAHRGAAEVLLSVSEGKDPGACPDEVFSARLIGAGLHRRPWYDLRGYRGRAAKRWASVRDYEEAFSLLAAHLNDSAPGEILPTWERERQQSRRRRQYTRLATGAVFASLVAVAAVQLTAAAERQRVQQVDTSVHAGLTALGRGDEIRSLPPLIDALELEQGHEREMVFRARIADVLQRAPTFKDITTSAKVSKCAAIRDASALFLVDRDSVTIWNLDGGSQPLVAIHQPHLRLADWSEDDEVIWTVARDRAQSWNALTGAPVDPPIDIPHGGAVALSPRSNRLFASAAGSPPILVDLSSGVVIAKIGADEADNPGSRVPHATGVFSPDGSMLLTHSDETIRISSSLDGTERVSVRLPEYVRRAAFSGSGNRIVAVSGAAVIVADAASGMQIGPAMPHKAPVADAALDDEGEEVIIAFEDGSHSEILVWRLATDDKTGANIWEQHVVGRIEDEIEEVRFANDDDWIVAQTQDGVWIWSAVGHLVAPRLSARGEVRSLAPLGDGRLLIADDTGVRLWTLAGRGAQLGQRANVVGFDTAGKRVVVAGGDYSGGEVRVVDIDTKTPAPATIGLSDEVEAAVFRQHGAQLVTLTSEGDIQVWNAETGHPLAPALRRGDGAGTLDPPALFSTDGTVAVFADVDEEFETTSIATRFIDDGTEVATDGFVCSSLEHLALNPDGRLLACRDFLDWDVVRLVDSRTGRSIGEPIRHQHLDLLKFSPDGAALLTAGLRALQVWDVDAEHGLKRRGTSIPREGTVVDAALAPGNELVAILDPDERFSIWSVSSGERRATLGPQAAGLTGQISFSADARFVLTRTGDVRVWDVATMQPVTGSITHDGVPVAVAVFHPSGWMIGTIGDDGTARLWDFVPDERSISDLRQAADLLQPR